MGEAPAEEEPDDGLTTEEREAMQEGSGAQVEYQRNSGVINIYILIAYCKNSNNILKTIYKVTYDYNCSIPIQSLIGLKDSENIEDALFLRRPTSRLEL